MISTRIIASSSIPQFIDPRSGYTNLYPFGSEVYSGMTGVRNTISPSGSPDAIEMASYSGYGYFGPHLSRAAGQTITFSVYIKNTSGASENISIWVYDTTGAVERATTYISTPDSWTLFAVTYGSSAAESNWIGIDSNAGAVYSYWAPYAYVSAFTDPRIAAGKAQLLGNTLVNVMSSTSEGSAIKGPGLVLDARRYTAIDANSGLYIGSPYNVAWPTLTGGATYTISIYIRTSVNINTYLTLGNASAQGGFQTTITSSPDWKLFEFSGVAGGTAQLGIWIGLWDSFTPGEWIDIALPMIYAGNKIT